MQQKPVSFVCHKNLKNYRPNFLENIRGQNQQEIREVVSASSSVVLGPEVSSTRATVPSTEKCPE